MPVLQQSGSSSQRCFSFPAIVSACSTPPVDCDACFSGTMVICGFPSAGCRSIVVLLLEGEDEALDGQGRIGPQAVIPTSIVSQCFRDTPPQRPASKPASNSVANRFYLTTVSTLTPITAPSVPEMFKIASHSPVKARHSRPQLAKSCGIGTKLALRRACTCYSWLYCADSRQLE